MKFQLFNLWLRIQKFFIIFIAQPIRILIIRFNIEHIYGPQKIDYSVNELIALCLVRDGELYIKSFIEHYLSLGVKHIIFLDNNSTDNTVSIAKSYSNVTVFQTTLPFKRNKLAMRLYLTNRFGKGRWSIMADIDELFDYPFSDTFNLSSLLQYLNERSYTAVVAHMLDMFQDDTLSSRESQSDDSLKDLYTYYDISDIFKMDFFYPRNLISNDKIKVYFGGIRKTLFMHDSTDVMSYDILTKHPLIFLDRKIRPLFYDGHGVRNAKIADFSCVLFHYKFLSDFHARTIRIVQEESYGHNSGQYKKYLKALNQNPNLQIKQETSQKLNNVNELVNNRFLVVSDNYLQWVQTNAHNQQKANSHVADIDSGNSSL
jgi:hypothetical protein